jgi:hypothetical protein
MSLFSKKRSSDAEPKQQGASEPFIVDDQIVARIAELMRMFNDAGGNFERVTAIASNISSAAGLHSLEQLLRGEGVDSIREWMDRPWKMLAAVAQRSAQNADHFLVARIFGFMFILGTLMEPHLTRADWVEMLMSSSPPPAVEAEIATVTLGSLQRLQGDWIIFGDTTGSVTAGDFTIAAARMLVQAPEKGVPVDESVLAAAKSIVG